MSASSKPASPEHNKQFVSKLTGSSGSVTVVKEEPKSGDEAPESVTAKSDTAGPDAMSESKLKGRPPKVGNYICSECNRFFKKKKTLLRHKQLSHAPQTAARTFRTRKLTTRIAKWPHHRSPSDCSTQKKSCPYCDKTFVGLTHHYHLHVERHRAAMDAAAGRRRNKIATLALAAAQKRNQEKILKPPKSPEVVIKSEAPESPPPTEFLCSVCDQKFVEKELYRRHMAYHRERARLKKRNHAPDTALSDSRCLGCKRSLSNQTELRNHLVLRRNDSKHALLSHYILSHCFSKLKLAQTPVETFHHLTTNPFSPYDPPSQLLHPKAFATPLRYSTGKEVANKEQSQNAPSKDADKGGTSEAVTDWECGACFRYFSCEEDYNSHFLARREDAAHGLVARYLLAHQ